MLKSYFQDFQIILLIISGLSLIVSLLAFRSKPTLGLLLLGLTGFAIFLFGASLDNYLNLWDERFHALVAKNLMTNPLKPMLYKDPILDIDYNYWALAHIWMHKQPLFLWQSALSFKLFGISAFSFRIPSVLLSCGMVFTIYRSAKIVADRNAAYIAALLFISSFFFLELISGRQGLDQNDISFTAYISFSIWSFLEYQRTQNKKWLILIGVFSGFAVLTKWLVGLLVYLIWSVFILLKKEFKQVKNLLLSLLLTIVVFLPWQLYCYFNYQQVYLSEMSYSTEHFFKALEGHSEGLLYYFDFFSVIYGNAMDFIFLIGVFLIFREKANKELMKALILSTAFVYLFFTAAQTKMEGYTAINALVVFTVIGYALSATIKYLEQKVKNNGIKKMLFSITIVLLVILRFDIEKIQENHTNWKGGCYIYNMQTNNKKLFEDLVLKENDVLFNIPYLHYIEAMFYTENTAYSFIPSEEQLKELQKKGYNALIFKNKKEEFESYLHEFPSVIMLENSFY